MYLSPKRPFCRTVMWMEVTRDMRGLEREGERGGREGEGERGEGERKIGGRGGGREKGQFI